MTKSIGINVLIHFSRPSRIPLATIKIVITKKSVCQKIKDVGLDITVLSSKTAICLYSKPMCPVPVVGDTLTKSALSCLYVGTLYSL